VIDLQSGGAFNVFDRTNYPDSNLDCGRRATALEIVHPA
jgi:hypothetical protein